MVKKSTGKTISPQELEKIWRSFDLSRLWMEVAVEVSKKTETYRIARAKSKAQAANMLFI